MDQTEANMQPSLFVPADFVVPLRFANEQFVLRPLTTADVERDYEALMASASLLHRMFGRDWPTANFTLAENLQDLAEHEHEFAERSAFTYTVLSPDETSCLGCVYINPPRGLPVDARVYLWVRQTAYAIGLDRILFQTVKAWLASAWPFKNVIYPGRNQDGSWES